MLLVQPDEQDKGPERHAPAQKHAGNAEGPSQARHGEGKGENAGADHRGEVVLFVFFSGFFEILGKERRRERPAFRVLRKRKTDSDSPRIPTGPWHCATRCPSGARSLLPWSVFFFFFKGFFCGNGRRRQQRLLVSKPLFVVLPLFLTFFPSQEKTASGTVILFFLHQSASSFIYDASQQFEGRERARDPPPCEASFYLSHQ